MFDLVQTLKEPHVAINGAISRNGVPRRTGVDRRTTRHQGGRSHISSAAQSGGSLRDLARDHPETAVRYRARIPVKHDTEWPWSSHALIVGIACIRSASAFLKLAAPGAAPL